MHFEIAFHNMQFQIGSDMRFQIVYQMQFEIGSDMQFQIVYLICSLKLHRSEGNFKLHLFSPPDMQFEIASHPPLLRIWTKSR